ncbi:copialike pol polyprotein, partial [Acanthamoeba castellanii str. Neff]
MWCDKPDCAHGKCGGEGCGLLKQDKGGERHGHGWKSSKGPKQGPQEGDETTCHYCHKPGHWRNKCLKLNWGDGGDGGGGGGDSHKVNAAQAQHESDEDEEIILSIANQTDQWYLDSGATCHVTCRCELLHNYQPSRSTINLVLGNDFKCCVKGTGTIHATIVVDSTMKTIVLMDVYYAPELAKNLVSMA